MREAEVLVTFRPAGKTVYVLEGTRLLEAAAGAGIVVAQPCGGEGVCGKCRALVTDGVCEPTVTESKKLPAEELRRGWRLVCQTSVRGPTTVDVPQTSLLEARGKILVRSADTSRPAGDPAIRKQYVELPVPSRGDDDADLVRLEKAVGPFGLDLDALRRIPRKLRETNFRGTAVLAELSVGHHRRDAGTTRHLIDFEPENTESETFAVALDVGTTTLVGVLLDISTGGERAVTSRMNPQTRFGDDVVSRIMHSRQSPDGLRELHETIITAINEMIGELVEQAAVSRERVYDLCFSGNTTMQQLLCNVDCGSLAEVPFVPAMGCGLLFEAAKLGLHVHPRGRAYVLPVIGGFVGGDTVSGILATGLPESEGPTLLVDIGTNGEIVLSAGGKLSAASTAAGPAFEGARISHGMRGSIGAIEKVTVDGRLRINVIGDVPPVGLCGSALIDLAAELLRHRLLTPQGCLLRPNQLPDGVLPDLTRRLVSHNGQPAFLLVPETETGHGKPVMLTQRDIRELQLATGAIRAGIRILLRRAGLGPADLDEVLIAGGFGNFIRRSNAQRIGLMPDNVAHRRIRYQGNTSLAGSRLVALSRQARSMADDLARRTEHVDLSREADFRTAFAEAMIFPEEDDE